VLKGDSTPHTLSIALGDINNDKKLDIIMAQGEGEKEIEERIFLGNKIKPDTAPPIISHQQTFTNKESNTSVIKARIHDNKSPNMPQDWRSIEVIPNEKSNPIPMSWYGENLWKVELSNATLMHGAKICATDYCGNKQCIPIKP
jgi:hypothetical protein